MYNPFTQDPVKFKQQEEDDIRRTKAFYAWMEKFGEDHAEAFFWVFFASMIALGLWRVFG